MNVSSIYNRDETNSNMKVKFQLESIGLVRVYEFKQLNKYINKLGAFFLFRPLHVFSEDSPQKIFPALFL